MQLLTLGTVNYKILSQNKVFWEYDFKKAKLLYEELKKKNKFAKLILEQWEGEIGGDGVHSEDVLLD